MYMQRYIEHFPAAGEIVIFDRSWYNRAGVEYVMGFCTPSGAPALPGALPEVEQFIVDGGILLIKFWLEVGQEEQERRFEARIEDPLRQWKLSPMDLEFVRALVRVLAGARHDARGDRHRVCALAHRPLGRQAARAPQRHPPPAEPDPLQEGDAAKVKLPKRSDKGSYDDQATLKGRRFVAEQY